MNNCSNCSERIPDHVRNCPSCQTDVGFPNVRAAQAIEERDALKQRLADAYVSARARNCEEILEDFGNAIKGARVVIARNIGIVSNLVSSDTELYVTYYKQFAAGTRLPENNPWDRGRSAVDGTLFPNYHQEIVFAALTLNNCSPSSFGAYTIVLKDEMIRHRSTVFEENSFLFCMQKHRIVVGEPIPPGYRAVWAEKYKLAMAKLHSKISPGTIPGDYANILMSNNGNPSTQDFIEVHIYGPIHRRSIERIVGPEPRRREDKALLKSIRRKLREFGGVFEVTP